MMRRREEKRSLREEKRREEKRREEKRREEKKIIFMKNLIKLFIAYPVTLINITLYLVSD
jgi:hypothetical protein